MPRIKLVAVVARVAVLPELLLLDFWLRAAEEALGRPAGAVQRPPEIPWLWALRLGRRGRLQLVGDRLQRGGELLRRFPRWRRRAGLLERVGELLEIRRRVGRRLRRLVGLGRLVERVGG